MADDDSSELSSLSSGLSPAPESDNEMAQSKPTIETYFKKLPKGQKPSSPEPPPRPPRPASPPHEYVLADNADISFLVMFRSRFTDAFPKSLPNFGPQELERDVSEPAAGTRVEQFLCAILGLLLNRKQDIKSGHYQRALDEAISTHKSQWPKEWEKNPMSGGGSFDIMTPPERLTLLRTLVHWALSSSDAIKGIINQSYKQNRHEDDLNQPLSVQPWGSDSDKRRYFLIEGLDDTAFRVYRESNPAGFNRTWWSVAGSIDELSALIDKLLNVDAGPKARKLAQKMLAAIPRFEVTEEKRKRREYRQQQKERFKRPEPGFSLYEGRTRGKRMKYTYSDDDDFMSDSTGARRSARNTGVNTPAEPAGPVTTASGRQIKAPSRMTVDSANNIVTTSPEHDDQQIRAASKESSVGPTGRPKRSAAVNHGTNGWAASKSREYNSMSESDSPSEPELGDDEEEHVPEDSEEEDDEMEDEETGDDAIEEVKQGVGRMMVKLKMPSKEAAERSGLPLDLEQFRFNGATSTSPPAAGKNGAANKNAESISVAPRKEATPEATPPGAGGTTAEPNVPALPPATPSLQQSLAFRESPEKLQAHPRSVNVAMAD